MGQEAEDFVHIKVIFHKCTVGLCFLDLFYFYLFILKKTDVFLSVYFYLFLFLAAP